MYRVEVQSRPDGRRRLLSWSALALALVLISAVVNTAEARGQDGAEITVIAAGLNNPRGLAIGGSGAIFVAESGYGGEGPCETGPEGGEICFGLSGSIARINTAGTLRRVITGLPSSAEPPGLFAIGPSDVSMHPSGAKFATIGLGGDPAFREMFGDDAVGFGHLIRIKPNNGTWRPAADIAAWEEKVNPDGGVADSNPNSVWARRNSTIVADAGGNALLKVTDDKIRALAVFPDVMADNPFGPGQIPMQAVPTSVVKGPDGSHYVGQLTGFPFPVGGASVWKVPTGGGTPELVASGFTNIMDLAFGPDGTLYVLEIATNSLLSEVLARGALWEVTDGTKSLITDKLFYPGGVVVADDGAIYVTNNSILPGAGQVLKITLPT